MIFEVNKSAKSRASRQLPHITRFSHDTSRAQFGVYFTQQQDVFTSYSSWLLTITVDLSPYNNQYDSQEFSTNASYSIESHSCCQGKRFVFSTRTTTMLLWGLNMSKKVVDSDTNCFGNVSDSTSFARRI